MTSAILFDIGGTNMRVAYSRDGSALDAIKTRKTPKDFREGIAALKALAKEAAGGEAIGQACGCVPGIFNRDRRTLFKSPNLPLWEGQPLLSALEDAFRVSVSVGNDAAFAGLGEAHRGAGRGFRSVMYMTVSTGVGGSRIVNGKIDENAFGYEPGKQIMDFAGNRTLESLVSGTALAKRFGKSAKEIPQIDPVWSELAQALARGLHNSIVHWSPDVIVLGGSMILGNPYIVLGEAESELKKILTIFPEMPAIRKAELGDSNGLYGALEFLKSKRPSISLRVWLSALSSSCTSIFETTSKEKSAINYSPASGCARRRHLRCPSYRVFCRRR